MTPLRRLTGLTEPIRVHRALGLWAYAYLCLDFPIYLVFDLEFSLRQLGDDLIKRAPITLGFAAWLMLLPLAITSIMAGNAASSTIGSPCTSRSIPRRFWTRSTICGWSRPIRKHR
ncbi:ferric reductase-like transmembrane domain-containing protein [Methylocaldum sp. 14B]|jgi:hypothetical protein|uniref:ferric reductase-like transmembrane domain-containing protein n=1 Tax=unclassified Methylocaldum TaxID=2622260 RepID=UPI00098AF32E|nr:ferric reductase-like transmembrane domain-containing protein [Methylocaldum sp. 14B]